MQPNQNLQVNANATNFYNFTENVTAYSDVDTTYDFTMQAYPGNVTGVVTSSAGGNVTGVNVTIGGISATTDQNGVYLITGVAARPNVAVSAVKQHFANFNGSVNVLSAVNNTYNFTMQANPGNVTGTVTSSVGGNIPNVTVTIAGVRGTTDSNGNYILTGVTAGSNQAVTASAVGFHNYYGNTPVVSDENTTYNFTMIINPGNVTGIVTSSAGGNVAGANVTIGNTTVSTDSNGEYLITGIDAGPNVAVTAVKQHFANFTGSLYVQSAINNQYNFTMTADPGTVTGTVASSLGGNVPNVTVTIAGMNGTTDPNGNYTITGIPASQDQAVTASAAGFYTYYGNTPVASDTDTPYNFTMIAEPGTVYGIVTSSYNGDPVPGASVTIAGVTGITGADGNYTLNSVTTGNDSVNVRHRDTQTTPGM